MSEITGKGDRKINQEQAIRNFMRQYLNKPKDGQMLHSMLENLGEHYEADRAYIFEMDPERTEFNNAYEWCREGISEEIDNLQHIPVEGLEFWL